MPDRATMTKLERVQAALRREATDRVPYAFWRHFPEVDHSPAALAQSTLRFHERYGSDFLKVTPRGGYAVEDWGCVESDEVAPDGHRPCARHAVRSPDDWKTIRPLPVESTGWGEHLESIIRCVVDRRADCSTLPTVFSPLSLARKLSGERLNYDLKENPGAVTGALEAITETILTFVEACFVEGVEGIFYSIQAASRDWHTEEEYLRFGEPYDRRILEAVRPTSKLTIVHGHGANLMFDHLARLPADAWNWDDRRAGPSLRDAQARVPGAVMGGLDQWATLRDGSPEAARAEAQDAIAETAGRGVILAAGCVLPVNTPDLTLVDLIKSIGGQVKLGLFKPR
jgi:uroporphyrinogen decarboxylase